MTTGTSKPPIIARALQLADRLDLKALDRAEAYSKTPLAFSTKSGGHAILFRSGAAVFLGLDPIEEENIIASLQGRLIEPLKERESETVEIFDRSDEDSVAASGAVHLKQMDVHRILLVADVLASAVSLSYDERRVSLPFERVTQVAEALKSGELSRGNPRAILKDIGDALSIQARLAGRTGLDEKPDVLWEHPELERLWMKLAEEFDIKSRATAVAQKLAVIKDSAETLGGVLATRTSHRLEWYVIALIALEIGLGLYDRIWK